MHGLYSGKRLKGTLMVQQPTDSIERILEDLIITLKKAETETLTRVRMLYGNPLNLKTMRLYESD